MKSHFFILLFSFFCLSACKGTLSPDNMIASAAQPAFCTNLLDEEIFDRNGSKTDYKALLRVSAQADYILLGETHTDPRHHQIQMDILKRTGANTVLFEMLEPMHEQIAAQYAQGQISSVQLHTGLQWQQRGWPIWNAYYPIFEVASGQKALIGHASLDSELIHNVNKFGVLALPRRLRQELKLKPGEKSVVDFNEVRNEIKRSHSIDDTTAQRLAISQYVKDAYMAYRLSESKPKAVLIAGRGHVRTDIGVPVHLKQYRDDAKIVSIGLLERSNGNADLKAQLKQYDYIWITAPQCVLHPPA
ncbi:ChaN family lipoprotein [Brucella intermedia]|uniref:ChaN family lipoprotein n=1 Tax=Brucella intermedia TaxID=94625 RepID=UPI00236051DA|nr:ChaN family lipoprotein [Brucella intermedia]